MWDLQRSTVGAYIPWPLLRDSHQSFPTADLVPHSRSNGHSLVCSSPQRRACWLGRGAPYPIWCPTTTGRPWAPRERRCSVLRPCCSVAQTPICADGMAGWGQRLGVDQKFPAPCTASPPPPLAQSRYSRLTLLLVLCVEVVCTVVYRGEKRASSPQIWQAFPEIRSS